MDGIAGGHGRHVADIAPHGGVVFRQYGTVSGVEVKIPGDQDQGAVPCGAAAPVVAPATGGDDPGKLAALPLHVMEIPQPLAIGSVGIEIQEDLFGRQMRIAGPAVLFPVRAIRGNAVVIAEGGPACGALDGIQQII